MTSGKRDVASRHEIPDKREI